MKFKDFDVVEVNSPDDEYHKYKGDITLLLPDLNGYGVLIAGRERFFFERELQQIKLN